MTGLPAPTPIREYEGVDRARFLEDIRPAGRPAVLRGLGAGWPAVAAGRKGPEAIVGYLKDHRPTRRVGAIVGPPGIEGRFFYSDDMRGFNFSRGEANLEDVLDRLLRDAGEARPFAMAIQSEAIPSLLPGFAQANATDLVDSHVEPRIWIGNAIRVAPHYDLKENIGVVVAGRRRFTVFPPDQLANLYPGPFELTPAGTPVSMVELARPDLDRFPRFAAAMATAQTAELAPGDAIYLPFQWWHAVDSLDPVSIFVNYWWTEDDGAFGNAYGALVHALLTLRPLPAEQRAAWRRMFDHYVFADGDPAAHLPPHAKGMMGPPSPEVRARLRTALNALIKEG
ncbi:MAG TPA: cupin-like domain-containing protein [Sphingomonas sp.]|nr:cupin-like domain-containing protein [Sphingomonas sp.]